MRLTRVMLRAKSQPVAAPIPLGYPSRRITIGYDLHEHRDVRSILSLVVSIRTRSKFLRLAIYDARFPKVPIQEQN